jgi:hypothetical protein
LDGKFNRRVKVKIIRKFFAGVIIAAMCNLSMVLNALAADVTVVHPGINVFGDGTKGSGYFISDSVEYLSTGTGVGTLTTVAVNGSETVYIEVDIVAQAGTSTQRMGGKYAGVFDRDGAASLTKVGTSTITQSKTAGFSDPPVYFTAGTDNAIHLNVKAIVAKKVQWVGTVKYVTVTTTGGE